MNPELKSRIVIHDYPGHAFPVQLSRHLAAQGHQVWHIWSADIEAPRGPLARRADDPATLTLLPLSLGKPLAKYNLLKRFFTERAYAKLFINTVAPLKPEVILSNPSPFIQGAILAWAKANGVAFVSWLQDVYYLPLAKLLQQKLPYLGALPVAVVKWYELKVLRQSTHTITIAPAFNDFLVAHGQVINSITCIGNWPILEEMPVLPKANAWAKRHSLDKTFNFVYSGTLGLKHNPQLLVDLAQKFAGDDSVRLIVVTQGLGRQFLEAAKTKYGLENLILLDYQPFEDLPYVLATADVLVSLLEPEAGVFSVPSKILNYLCAGRPVLGAMPLVNQASKTITEAHAGVVVEPTDGAGFLATAQALRNDQALAKLGQAGRSYAEANYAIATIGLQFEQVFTATRQGQNGQGLLIFDSSGHGHRQAYLNLFQTQLQGQILVGQAWRHWWRLLFAPKLLFATLEGNLRAVLLLGCLRAVMGKPTAAIMLRTGECFLPNMKYRIKYWLFRCLKLVPNLTIMPILPYEIFPEYQQVSRSYLYDPQLWDLADYGPLPTTALSRAVQKQVKSRPIVVALGVQNSGKGFAAFTQLARVNQAAGQPLRLVAAGKLAPECQAMAAAFQAAGGQLENRIITDEELLSLYGCASFIWCCYAPVYDQASGIFGRAAQFGVPVLTRQGSLIERFRQVHGINGLALNPADAAGMLASIKQTIGQFGTPTRVLAHAWRVKSLDNLRRALKVF